MSCLFAGLFRGGTKVTTCGPVQTCSPDDPYPLSSASSSLIIQGPHKLVHLELALLKPGRVGKRVDGFRMKGFLLSNFFKLFFSQQLTMLPPAVTLPQLKTLKNSLSLAKQFLLKCPACYNNILRFSCGFVCSPIQSEFIKTIQTETFQGF